MKMTPVAIIAGSLLILIAVIMVVIILPYADTNKTIPSDLFRTRTAMEESGRHLYIANGCVYCHTQSIRSIDWGLGAERIAQAGDYTQDLPILLGSQRTGPDLSQEGGEHPNDWHLAHFTNPRTTRPLSIMPPFAFLQAPEMDQLTTYVQSLGLTHADARMQRQDQWKQASIQAYEAGIEQNVQWLHQNVPQGWRTIPSPYAATAAGLARGEKIYQDFCFGCHGPVGDGMGPAQPFLYPPPLNFTILKGRGVSGGIIYYQIMNGITGTAMPYFKRELESEKIWDVGNYIATYFINEIDANQEPKGIDAAYEK
ncbi:cbb3-type cytochrome c oxidase subunit II [bacterium]|nr:cbb3-type cytochrome c oxidase subunit II [bacterium]